MRLQTPGYDDLTLMRPRMMGILNLTPDSFSDGARYDETGAAVEAGLAMARQGASVIDVGGESTRPGAERVSAEQQRQRVLPVIEKLRAALEKEAPQVRISIDTTLAVVAAGAVEAGASMLNDVSAGGEDEGMFVLAAERGLPIVLMHMQGTPATMQENPTYTDVVSEVRDFLVERAARAEAAGVARSQVVLDPGIGFGKTLEHNLTLLRELGQFVATGYPVLLGVSRKGFIGKLSPGTTASPADRVGGTCAVTALAVQAGVRFFRVHDVRENLQAAEVAEGVGRRG